MKTISFKQRLEEDGIRMKAAAERWVVFESELDDYLSSIGKSHYDELSDAEKSVFSGLLRKSWGGKR